MMFAKFYTPTGTPADMPKQWRELIPAQHWRTGYSAKALAHSWTDAGGFPPEVQNAFNQSGVPALNNVRFQHGFPEHEVALHGIGKASTNDILVYARGHDGTVCIAVEGKMDEPFGDLVGDWGSQNAGPNKEKRLAHLLEVTDMSIAKAQDIRYQLLHRTASALIRADEEKPECKTAVMLVHSFSQKYENFRDFVRFADAMGGTVGARADCILYAKTIHGINLYLGWITGEEKYLHK